MKWISTPSIGDELGQGVQPRLELAPVIAVRPIIGELACSRKLHALGAVAHQLPAGPAGGKHASAEIREHLVRGMVAERADCVVAIYRGGRGRIARKSACQN